MTTTVTRAATPRDLQIVAADPLTVMSPLDSRPLDQVEQAYGVAVGPIAERTFGGGRRNAPQA